jgi:hypothetical protein
MYQALPSFLKRTAHHEPVDKLHNAFQDAGTLRLIGYNTLLRLRGIQPSISKATLYFGRANQP